MRTTESKVVEALNRTASGNCAAAVLDNGDGLNRAVPERRRWHGTLRWGFIALVLAAGGCAGRQHLPKDNWISVARREAMPLRQLADRVRGYRIVILAETHGLVEPIETLRMLLSDTNRSGWTHVAFEWSESDQPDLDRFMAGEDAVLQRFRQRYGQLPGGTTEYIETFAFIREGNRAHPDHLITVRATDVPHPVRNVAEEERDLHMFNQIEALLEASPSHRVLVHCGDSHAAKCGLLELPTRDGGKQSKPTLGTLLCRRFPGEVVSIDVLSRYDPMWWQIKNEAPFESPVVLPVSTRWPEASSLGLPLWGLPLWHPDSRGKPVSAKAVFDYVVWWPTSRAGTREQ